MDDKTLKNDDKNNASDALSGSTKLDLAISSEPKSPAKVPPTPPSQPTRYNIHQTGTDFGGRTKTIDPADKSSQDTYLGKTEEPKSETDKKPLVPKIDRVGGQGLGADVKDNQDDIPTKTEDKKLSWENHPLGASSFEGSKVIPSILKNKQDKTDQKLNISPPLETKNTPKAEMAEDQAEKKEETQIGKDIQPPKPTVSAPWEQSSPKPTYDESKQKDDSRPKMQPLPQPNLPGSDENKEKKQFSSFKPGFTKGLSGLSKESLSVDSFKDQFPAFNPEGNTDLEEKGEQKDDLLDRPKEISETNKLTEDVETKETRDLEQLKKPEPMLSQSTDYSSNNPFSPPPPPPSGSTGSSDFNDQLPDPPAKKSIMSKVIIGLVILVILAGIGLLAKNFLFKSDSTNSNIAGTKTVITYWGLWESDAVMNGLIEQYEKDNPSVDIQYINSSKQDYYARLQNSFNRNPPDIFRIHNTWLPILKSKLAPVPQDTVEKLGLNTDYFSVVSRTLSSGNQFYAIPLMVDNLALFYNKELLAATGETPPRTWWGMQDLAKNIKVTDEKGNLKIASVPLGTTNNIDHWSDILGLMMVQNGVNLEQPTTDPELIQDVLEFYSLFYVRDKVWDATFPNSTLAFATNKTIFYFGPSWRIFNIMDINPNLDFAVTSVPKLPKDLKRNDPEAVERGEGELSERNWASYWVEGVSAQSSNQKEAWKFLEFLSQNENLQQFYQAASQTRAFGEIYPVKDLASSLSSNPKLAPFIDQADTSYSWYLCSSTHDNGPNDVMIQYFENAINSINNGSDPAQAAQTLVSGIGQTMSRYGM